MDFSTRVGWNKKVECLNIYLDTRGNFAWSLNGFARFAAQYFNVSAQDILDDHNMIEVFVGRLKSQAKTNNKNSTVLLPIQVQNSSVSTKVMIESVEKSYSRKGQAKFRSEILKLYNSCCVVTRTIGPVGVDAAHIHPYAAQGGHNKDNGLVLRKDIHDLFDKNEIGLRPEGDGIFVELSSKAHKDTYSQYTIDKITFDRIDPKPRREALEKRYEQFCKKNGL